MEENKNSKNNNNIIIIILSLILILLVGFICYDKFMGKETSNSKKDNCPICEKCNTSQQESKCSYNLDELLGTYYGEKEHPNNNKLMHKVELVLKDNNEAVLHQSDGGSADYTKGSFVCNHNRIIYTPLYNDDDTKYQSNNEYTFIIDKEELNYFYASTFPINLKRK